MVKKIKKYLKFAVCCALIMSLVAPSYAALSASDGSAFVTKAEFDAALADFNSRLTTFEAGINSKIDSQVTSYLDRNGIWSGKEQSFSFGVDDSVYGALYDASTGEYVSPLYNATDSTMFIGNAYLQGFTNTANPYTTNTQYAWVWFLPVFKSAKTGLAFFNFHVIYGYFWVVKIICSAI